MRVLATIGGAFLFCTYLGALVPGVAYHVYFGTEEGPREWHQKHAQPKEDKQQ